MRCGRPRKGVKCLKRACFPVHRHACGGAVFRDDKYFQRMVDIESAGWLNTHVFSPVEGLWGYSSVGRALEWHSRGRGFDSPYLHHFQKIKNRVKPDGYAVFCCCLVWLNHGNIALLDELKPFNPRGAHVSL